MPKTLTKEQSGVTIVELMIVIAVAALIIVLVLVAAPALQRNARNTQRRNDIGAIRGQLSTIINNNNNVVPDAPVFGSDVLGQIDQAIYKGNNFVANGVSGFCTLVTTPTPDVTTLPTTAQGSMGACEIDHGSDSIIDGTWTAPMGGIPATASENAVYYIRVNDQTELNTEFGGQAFPSPDELHIVIGARCASTQLSDGNTKIDGMNTYPNPTTADLVYRSQKTVSFVYQLEGETKARCEDNA